jgi:dTDP-4-amino-4,6-dideoxygalactose transaminase
LSSDEAASWAVPLSDIRVDAELRNAVAETLDSGWWSMGPRVAEFERAYADFLGIEHALAVANGTAALHLALLAVGCGPGDEVVLPSLNFVAAANAIANTGATPVFCDVRGDEDLNLDPDDLRAALGTKTKAIVVLHYGGNACDMDAVREIATEHGVDVIEDAAHAPGATWRGERCGTLGRIACFSFFANKNLPVGEGGMIVTGDGELAERVRLLRSHGMTTLTWDRQRGHAGGYDVLAQGFNYRLDEIRAAMGIVLLGRLERENSARAQLAARYRDALHDRQGITMPFGHSDRGTTSSHHLAVALLPASADRDAVRAALQAKRIQTSVHYPPIHLFTQYREVGARRPLPRTESVAARLLTLPLYAHMDGSQADMVVDALLDST